jgi:hypothetical protein
MGKRALQRTLDEKKNGFYCDSTQAGLKSCIVDFETHEGLHFPIHRRRSGPIYPTRRIPYHMRPRYYLTQQKSRKIKMPQYKRRGMTMSKALSWCDVRVPANYRISPTTVTPPITPQPQHDRRVHATPHETCPYSSRSLTLQMRI